MPGRNVIALGPDQFRVGMGDPARRPIGRMRTRLAYADPQLLPDQLGDLLRELQETCLEASQAITERYFSYGQPVAWEQEA